MQQLNGLIDHTLLRAAATAAEIQKLCEEATQYRFATVCVHPCWVPYAYQLLEGSFIKLCSVAGFPLGCNTTQIKVAEAKQLAEMHVDEIDMVLSVGALKSKEYEAVRDEIRAVVNAAPDSLIKVILETCWLTDEEKVIACQLSVEAGAHFVKTSTGFGKAGAGATVEDIALMRKTVGPHFGVKASGGIRDYATAIALIEAGANRLGTSSSVAIVTGS